MKSKIDYTKRNLTKEEKALMKNEVALLKVKYPLHVPIVVLAQNINLTKIKYLVGSKMNIAFLMTMIRKNTNMSQNDGFYVFVKNELVSNSMELQSLYSKHKDNSTDLLFLTLCKENTFGC